MVASQVDALWALFSVSKRGCSKNVQKCASLLMNLMGRFSWLTEPGLVEA